MELKDFAIEPWDSNSPVMTYVCKNADGYTIVIFARDTFDEKRDHQSIPIDQYPNNQTYNVQIIFKSEYSLANEYDFDRTKEYLKDKGYLLSHVDIGIEDVLVLLEKAGAITKAKSTQPSVSKDESKGICSECKGKKVLDLGFYTRSCMKCA